MKWGQHQVGFGTGNVESEWNQMVDNITLNFFALSQYRLSSLD